MAQPRRCCLVLEQDKPLQGRRLSPYHQLLGEAFDTLHPNVRRAHEAPLTAEGTFDVVHGDHRVTRMVVALMQLPAAGRRVPVTLSVAVGAARTNARPLTLRWERRIGRTNLSTHQYAHRGFLVEEQGPGRLVFSLRAADGCLVYEHAALRCLFLRVPPFLSPCVRARVSPDPEGWHVDVRVEWHGHLICGYGRSMRPSQAGP
jgi:hypothetical protein